MSKRKDDIEASNGESLKSELPKDTAKIELLSVESPSISPATPAPIIEPVAEAMPLIEPITAPASEITPAGDALAAPVIRPSLVLRPRHKRYAFLAASLTFAASVGAMVGSIAGSGGFRPETPRVAVAALEDRVAMQQTLGALNKEIATLKSNLDAANKSAQSQIAKITERFDRAASAELVTGSISAPQTTAPVPTPRPAPRIAAVEAQPPARSAVVLDWTIRDVRDGFVYVQGNGDAYQVVLGAPLPGLGPVESVKRQDGRWVVTTPKGIIVSMRDRRYFGSY